MLKLGNLFRRKFFLAHQLKHQRRRGAAVELLDEGLQPRTGDVFAADEGPVDVGHAGSVAAGIALLLQPAQEGQDGGVGDLAAPLMESVQYLPHRGRAVVPESLEDLEFRATKIAFPRCHLFRYRCWPEASFLHSCGSTRRLSPLVRKPALQVPGEVTTFVVACQAPFFRPPFREATLTRERSRAECPRRRVRQRRGLGGGGADPRHLAI